MRIVILTKDDTDYAREVSDWLLEYERIAGAGKIEVLNPETIEGEIFARAHDILQYPTIAAVSEQGSLMESWKGTPLPQIEQVTYWLNS